MKLKSQLPIFIVLSMLIGALAPLGIYNMTRIDVSSIPVPGIPLNQTSFSQIVQENFNQSFYHGDWSITNSVPRIATLQLKPPSISIQEGQDRALAFIREPLRSLVHLDSENDTDPTRVEWHFHFVGEGIGVHVWVNSITGSVAAYQESWQNKTMIERILGSFTYSMNRSAAETIARDYLGSIGFMASPDLLHLGTFYYPNGTYHPESSGPWNFPEYVIRFSYSKNNILPDQFLEGMYLKINAYSGWVYEFSQRSINLPQIPIDGIIGFESAENLALEESNEYRQNGLETTSLRLAFIPTEDSWWGCQQLQFILVWNMRIGNSTESQPECDEIHRNAYTGERLETIWQFLNIGNLGITSVAFLIALPVVSFLVAILGHLFAKRILFRRVMDSN